LVAELGEDAGMANTGNTVGSLAVLSGIASADTVCGAVLGHRAAGDNHAEAVKLLKQAVPGKNYAALADCSAAREHRALRRSFDT
jgi:hypothetical protein